MANIGTGKVTWRCGVKISDNGKPSMRQPCTLCNNCLRVSDDNHQRIEALFEAAKNNRTRAYELKRELDQLRVFDDYEDRFLDLFSAGDD
ncbi:MAG: hypothetical protein ABI557_11005 [Aureliella sp.]